METIGRRVASQRNTFSDVSSLTDCMNSILQKEDEHHHQSHDAQSDEAHPRAILLLVRARLHQLGDAPLRLRGGALYVGLDVVDLRALLLAVWRHLH